MVHARTFSFTDSASNVSFPTSSAKSTVPRPIAAPQSSDPALLLFQLRRAQSFWYQEFYQSQSAPPLPDPTSFVWQMCLEMREWGESLPSTLSPAIRQMFDQELRYSYVYCIAPSARAPQMTDYSRTLIFEYAVAYLDSMHEIAQTALNGAFYTYHDALKVYFMASQLMAVLWDAEDMLVNGLQGPMPVHRPGAPPPPPIPGRPVRPGMPMEDNLRRSLRCLEYVSQTLQKFGERWEESSMLKTSFEAVSRETVERLRRRLEIQDATRDQQQHQHQHQHQHHSMAQYQAGGSMPMSMQHQQQPPQQHQAREVRWVGVDVGQMMRGSAPSQPPR
jgi:hypothetical protein